MIGWLQEAGIPTLVVGAVLSAIAALFKLLKDRRRTAVDNGAASDQRILGSTETLVRLANQQRDDAVADAKSARDELKGVRDELRVKDEDFEQLKDALTEANRLLRATQQQLAEVTAAFEALRHRYDTTGS
ncbi:hypothetical protein [uncultured Friedmanniella sp.]|uniref:hypothetical protein n=1 Tax=uncultured Friedmanniella sp. TaxID=335381 RepID=UPI0035CB9DBB